MIRWQTAPNSSGKLPAFCGADPRSAPVHVLCRGRSPPAYSIPLVACTLARATIAPPLQNFSSQHTPAAPPRPRTPRTMHSVTG
jgi:hypothetical protein